MPDAKRVLLERLLNHPFLDADVDDDGNPRPIRLDIGKHPIWTIDDSGNEDSKAHQDWLFGPGADSLKNFTRDHPDALTKAVRRGTPQEHPGCGTINPQEIAEVLKLLEIAFNLFPTDPPNGEKYSQYDLYCLVRDKLLWNYNHGVDHCENHEKPNNLSKHTGY